MHTKEVTFPEEIENDVRKLVRKYASNFEFIASTKDGETYDVSFTSSVNYQNFFEEYNKLV